MNSSNIDSIIESLLASGDHYAAQVDALHGSLKTLAMDGDYAFLKEALQQYLDETQQLQQQLRTVFAQVAELEAIELRRELYNERWWQKKRLALHKAFKANPQDGWSQWLQTYVEALLDWQISTCKKLVTESFVFPLAVSDKLPLFQEGTQAIEKESYPQALDMLQYIVQTASARQSQFVLSDGNRAALLVLMGRMHLYASSLKDQTLALFEQARSLAPDDGLPYAALADYYQTLPESDQANQSLSLYHRAIELSPKRPDGYVGLGLMAEGRSAWDEATDWYKEAIGVVQEGNNAEIALRKLLAPVSGNLYLELARALKKSDPNQALSALEKALALGVKHDGSYPERFAYTLKGEVLEDLQKSVEAAQAHYEAGRRYAWRNECETARPILEHAKELDPTNAYIDLELSDVLRVCSYIPEYPYVNKAIIISSFKSWQISMAADIFAANKSWLYNECALINEQLARLPGYNPWELSWESVAYLERADLLGVDVNIRSYLARNYRTLEQGANALQLAGEALEIDAENTVALEERIATLATIGDFDAATKIIEQRQLLGTTVWVDMIRVFVLMSEKRYPEALSLILSLSDSSENDIWYHTLYADCCFVNNKLEDARKNYVWIWERYDANDADNMSTFGWSAYNLALLATDPAEFHAFLESAINIYHKLLSKREENPLDSGNNLRSLGMCYLAQGNIQLGEKMLLEGIALAHNMRELDDMISIDMFVIEKYFHHGLYKEQIVEALNRLKKTVEETKAHFKRGSSKEELTNVIKTYSPQESNVNWIWIAAQAGLARIYLKERSWTDAATTYLLLEKEGDRFLEASIGLQKTFDCALEKGDSALKEGALLQALTIFNQLFELGLLHDDKQMQASLHARLGYTHSELHDTENAYKQFIIAIQLYREYDAATAVTSFVQVCRTLLHSATQYWKLDDIWSAIAVQTELADNLRDDFENARKLLGNYLEEFYTLSEVYSDSEKLFPSSKPIILELGDQLIPEDTSSNWSLFKTYIPAMRQRVQERMGVDLPGISVQRNSYLAPDGYRILLDEAEFAAGNVYATMRYCPVSPQIIQHLELPDTPLIQARQPVTGEAGCWVSPASWPIILDHHLELWQEPIVFILYHLEAVLLRNLATFFGVQEAENLLQAGEAESAALIASALPDQYARYHFMQLLRTLLKQRVALTEWQTVLKLFQEANLVEQPVHKAVQVLRPHVRKLLFGNVTGALPLALAPGWEDTFISSSEYKDSAVFLAASPEQVVTFLSTIREATRERDWNVVLIVHNAELRPFIQHIVSADFPYLAVLSQEEWLSEEDLNVEQAKGTTSDAE